VPRVPPASPVGTASDACSSRCACSLLLHSCFHSCFLFAMSRFRFAGSQLSLLRSSLSASAFLATSCAWIPSSSSSNLLCVGMGLSLSAVRLVLSLPALWWPVTHPSCPILLSLGRLSCVRLPGTFAAAPCSTLSSCGACVGSGKSFLKPSASRPRFFPGAMTSFGCVSLSLASRWILGFLASSFFAILVWSLRSSLVRFLFGCPCDWISPSCSGPAFLT
jgi:hypothetical protein